VPTYYYFLIDYLEYLDVLWSQSPLESRFWLGVGVSHLKETPTPDPICLIWTIV